MEVTKPYEFIGFGAMDQFSALWTPETYPYPLCLAAGTGARRDFWMVLKPPGAAQTPKTDPTNSGQTAFRYPAYGKQA